jgi:hypothetical protein
LTAAEAEVKETLTTAEEEGEGGEEDEEEEEETAPRPEETGAAAGVDLTGENSDSDNQEQAVAKQLIFLVAILCYASYSGIIPNEDISSSIDNCTGSFINCLQGITETQDIVQCLPGTITSALTSAGVDITRDNLPKGVRSHIPISSLKKQLKLATYNLENIRNYCKKYLIESVSKEKNSRFFIVGIIVIVSTIACVAANPLVSDPSASDLESADPSELESEAKSAVENCAENVLSCLASANSSEIQSCLSNLI